MSKGSDIFKNVLDDAHKQISLDYDKTKGFGNSSIKGEERSEALADFLKSRLPPTFGVSTGEVIDSGDRRTGQLDIIIFDQTATRPVFSGKKNELYPCEAVYAVIEVKSELTKKELGTCLVAAQKLRRLKPFRQRFVETRDGGKSADGKAHRCMYIIFSFSSNLNEEKWLQTEYDRVMRCASEQKINKSVVDRLIILDRGIINPTIGRGKSIRDAPTSLFAEFFLHLVNFLEREHKRRPTISWSQYSLPQSKGWKTLKEIE